MPVQRNAARTHASAGRFLASIAVATTAIASIAVATIAVASIAVGCAGGVAKPPALGAGSADAGADGSAEAALTTRPPPSGLPPMATMPPPGVAGSKKATRRPDAALVACARAAKTPVTDPAERVKRLGDGCAAASKKMTHASTILRGRQTDKEAHQELKLRVAAHCYRLYVAADDAVKDIVVVLRDSAGNVIAESPGPAVPEDGVACFDAADDVSLLVSVGNGSGTWAAQLWSD